MDIERLKSEVVHDVEAVKNGVHTALLREEYGYPSPSQVEAGAEVLEENEEPTVL